MYQDDEKDLILLNLAIREHNKDFDIALQEADSLPDSKAVDSSQPTLTDGSLPNENVDAVM